ncbi:MAG: hypothetical protein DRJ50_15655 [Actinobacteria bacterium]|nr:MAG: hypothetical protein DRJ50_15655 [Actinomycetota bacterium]
MNATRARALEMMAPQGKIRDVLLPDTDLAAGVQAIVIILLTIVVAVLVRKERALVQLALGVGIFLLAMMGLRSLH